jgi:hypothetical protein
MPSRHNSPEAVILLQVPCMVTEILDFAVLYMGHTVWEQA